jgi:hypothetical protein
VPWVGKPLLGDRSKSPSKLRIRSKAVVLPNWDNRCLGLLRLGSLAGRLARASKRSQYPISWQLTYVITDTAGTGVYYRNIDIVVRKSPSDIARSLS